IDTRLFPLSLYCAFRQVLQSGNFRKGKSAEKLHIDQLSKLRLDLRQLIQGIAYRREFLAVDGTLINIRFERSDFEFATSLYCILSPGMIDDQSAHRPCGIAHESRPVREPFTLARGNVQVSFMQKRCSTQVCRGTFARQLSFCHPV